MSNNDWTDPLEELLVTWAEKASGYAWLHQKSVVIYKKRNLCISIPAALFGYISGITILLSNNIINDCSNLKEGPIIRGVVGVIGITAGILSNFQEMFTFKEEAEKHRIAALRFLSFFREISCELSLEPRFRSAPIDYITLKRFEFDKILEQSPDIPPVVVKSFNESFKNISIHKPDTVTGLQTILPYGKELRMPQRFICIDDKIILLKYFTCWKMHMRLYKYKKYGARNDSLIEVTNSRNSNNDEDIYLNRNRKVPLYDNSIFRGTLSEQKRFTHNQNIKIRYPPPQKSVSIDIRRSNT